LDWEIQLDFLENNFLLKNSMGGGGAMASMSQKEESMHNF
jgi:hypothetical protein